MKKNKKRLLLISIIAIVLLVGLAILYFINNYDRENALSLNENKWIDSNKYNVIDVALMNDIPILSYNGNGLVYDYLDYITNKLSLKFNVIPYKLDGTADYKYKLDIVDEPADKDIVLLEDNMVLITINGLEYSNFENINNLRIGVLKSDSAILTKYFNGKNVQFIEYNSYSELKSSFDMSRTLVNQNLPNTGIDAIVILKTVYTKEMIENNYNVSFQFNDLNKYFVLKTNGPDELDSILYKNYNIWKEQNYSKSYSDNFLANYFSFKNISDVEQKKLKSKSYVYGFIDYGVFNNIDKNKISGFGGLILNDFNKFSGLSITYTQYNSLNRLINDFNSKKVDFMFNISNEENYKTKIYNTVGVFNKKLSIISGKNNTSIIDDINSLNGKEVLIVKDTYLEKFLINNGAKVKSYNNMKDLTKDFNVNNIVMIDLENYNFYKSSAFQDSKINYIFEASDKYNYIINDIDDNKIFEDLFNFYLTYTSINKLISLNYESIAYENSHVMYILLILIIAILTIYVVVDFCTHIKTMLKNSTKKKKIHLSKEDKIKYIDQLTSLKNRAYLNSQIDIWDESEIYPQAIIVIDLNNISYINDNYGREEGDKVITEAANILIMRQLKNSEIIRTDGNEFLIYLVGYNEKQIISYRRKLNKELKGLSHGFGAASGYSIITDAIKTIDDAVNEATLDMKNNKEDIDY